MVTLEGIQKRYGEAVEVAPMVRRVVARNPSKFTYLGTGMVDDFVECKHGRKKVTLAHKANILKMAGTLLLNAAKKAQAEFRG